MVFWAVFLFQSRPFGIKALGDLMKKNSYLFSTPFLAIKLGSQMIIGF